MCVLRGEALGAAIARKPMRFDIEFVDALGHVAFAEELDVCLGPTEFQLPKPDGADSPTLTASSDPCPD